MSGTDKPYRTLIRGRLRQLSALSVGGAAGLSDHPDGCFRDGANRLTIPATSMAGALIEAAQRVFPDLLHDDREQRLAGYRVTAKKERPPQDDEEFLQSVWRFRHAHPINAVATEWRQSVGIRQATGASAREKRALYDFEVVPRGTQWTFFLEIDTFRRADHHDDGRRVEALAALALNEWVQRRGWIGRGPARGTGWIELHVDRTLRLPATEAVIVAWPDNTQELDATLDNLLSTPGVADVPWDSVVADALQTAKSCNWSYGGWHYLRLGVALAPGPSDSGYGLDVLQVAGHPAGDPSALETATPLSVPEGDGEWRGEFQQPDAPFVNTQPAGKEPEPFLPGSGLRGSLRHMASRLARPAVAVRDPNWKCDPETLRADGILDEKRKQRRDMHQSPTLLDRDVRPVVDELTQIFGAEELGSRLLVRDAELSSDGYALLQTEHHAEDEFTAGVYGTSKFDRHVLATGDLRFELLVEAPDFDGLKRTADRLVPALELARLGHMPIGGGKWRGAGWVPWRLQTLCWSRSGSRQIREQAVAPSEPLTAALNQLWEQKEPAYE